MCIIVAKPKGVKLKREIWAECFRCNGHGAGLTYVEDGDLVVDKGYFEFDELYPEIEKREDQEMIVHFRIASAGGISLQNCHPFYYESTIFPQYSWAITHNGTLPWRSTKDESDTNCFVYDLLGPHLDRDPYFLDSETGKVFLTRFIGERNKLAIMRYDRKKKETKTYIINESAGTKDLGVWFSNYSYRVVVHRPYSSGRYGGFDGFDRAYGDDYHDRSDHEVGGPAFERPFFDDKKDWSKFGYYKHQVSGMWWPTKTLKPLNIVKVDPKPENLKLEGGINVQVPRDADKEAKLAKDLRRDSRLEHLTNKGRKIYRRMAYDFAKATIKNWERLTAAQKISDFREEFRWACKDHDVINMGEECLDRYIVDKYKETGMFPSFMVTPSDPENGPEETDPDENPPLHEQSPPSQLRQDADALIKAVESKIEQFPKPEQPAVVDRAGTES
jgi:predicted glutamine amidotransferase